MQIQERLQTAIHMLEVGGGARVVRWLAIVLAMVAMMVMYDGCSGFHSFNAPEAMDAAQLARNLSEGRGYTTQFIRPFSLYLIQKRWSGKHPGQLAVTSQDDAAQVYTHHPDLANAPVYPVVLAGLFKATSPQWQVETRQPFWSEDNHFRRYKPEFIIAILNQILFFGVIVLTFLLAKKLFDLPAAWLTATLLFGSDALWKFSVSGLPTMVVMLLLLGLVWCLVGVEEAGRAERPAPSRIFLFAILAGLLNGLGMLTLYSFGWLIVPVIIFLCLYGGPRGRGLAAVTGVVFLLVVTPWLLRNQHVSGTLFGTAGYAVMENVSGFSGSRLMQSLAPDLSPLMNIASGYDVNVYGHKLMNGLGYILEGDLFRLGGGWLGVLFFAGLLLGIRTTGGRRLRHFTLMCLAVFILVQALGRTGLSLISPVYNSENLLVLLTPLIVMFGVVFFLKLLSQIELPVLAVQFGVVLALAAVLWEPLVSSLLIRVPPVAYPPYYPPDVQKICAWMEPDELMMSDIPWAVAWYGDRQCTWTTINAQYEFGSLHDYVKPVHGLYLSLNTLNGSLMTDCIQGTVGSWSNFAFKALAYESIPDGFPLRQFPQDSLVSGMFLTDRQRW